jgi:hypothetical protein
MISIYPDSYRERFTNKGAMKRMSGLFVAFLFCLTGLAQTKPVAASDSILITIFLKHQQDKNLDSLRKIQRKNKFQDMFPPPSARVVSWYVLMGIGQVVTVKIPASELRTLNLSIERGAWGAFTTEFYPTYDYIPIWKESKRKNP